MMTVHKLSTGDGHLYYTNEVASGDQLRSSDRELGDYYQVTGMPPGQWIGTGTEHFGVTGEQVTEAQMDALYGSGYAPISLEELSDVQRANRDAAVEKVRLAAASRALSGLKDYRSDKTQKQVAASLGVDRKPVYRRVIEHTRRGNLALADQAIATGDDQVFTVPSHARPNG